MTMMLIILPISNFIHFLETKSHLSNLNHTNCLGTCEASCVENILYQIITSVSPVANQTCTETLKIAAIVSI